MIASFPYCLCCQFLGDGDVDQKYIDTATWSGSKDEGSQTGRMLTNTGLRLRDSANITAINVKKAGIVNIRYKLVLTV